MKYKYTGTQEVNIPDAHVTVKKGDTFETDTEINNPEFVLVAETKEVIK